MLDSLVVHLEARPTSCSCSSFSRRTASLDDALRARIAGALRDGALAAPHTRHLVVVPSIPRTLTGKKLELPVKRILTGTPPRGRRERRRAR